MRENIQIESNAWKIYKVTRQSMMHEITVRHTDSRQRENLPMPHRQRQNNAKFSIHTTRNPARKLWKILIRIRQSSTVVRKWREREEKRGSDSNIFFLKTTRKKETEFQKVKKTFQILRKAQDADRRASSRGGKAVRKRLRKIIAWPRWIVKQANHRHHFKRFHNKRFRLLKTNIKTSETTSGSTIREGPSVHSEPGILWEA